MYCTIQHEAVTTMATTMSMSSEDDKPPLSDGQSDASSLSESDGDADFGPPPQQHNFAPPFYGRPPTPLPPSPSLTSLLRPSRPTTPDASDVELEPVARASPRVPTYEYYGFVLYLFSSLTFLIYLLWSYLPSPFLHALGIYYFPDRWWSLALPSFLVMTLVYTYAALASYNTEILTVPLGDVETIVDDAANVAVVDARGRLRSGEAARSRRRQQQQQQPHQQQPQRGRDGRAERFARRKELDWKAVWSTGTDAVMDVPLAGVCEVLYGEGRHPAREDHGVAVS